jgi:hypothetical protein
MDMKNKWHLFILVLSLAIVGWVVVSFMNLDYPMVGHDFRLTVPSLLDISLYYRVNGLSIQWYTPSFGGGIPVYPDPNYGTFSFLALLTLFFSPWHSAIISSVINLILGGICGYYFFRKILDLHWTSSILGMIFFIATGFFLERVAVGHMGYQAYPLISIFLIAFFDQTLPIWLTGLIAAVLVTLLINSAGYSLLIIFGFSFLLIFPIIYIYWPGLLSTKRMFLTLVIGGFVAFLMSGSKLAAIYSYMRFFPRQIADNYAVSAGSGLKGIFEQLLGTMSLAPILKIVGLHPSDLGEYLIRATGANYGYWEFDMALSPMVFGIFIVGAIRVIQKPGNFLNTLISEKKWVAWIVFGISLWVIIEFILAKGLIYPLIRNLPILNSIHVNPRFTASLIFPLALSAALINNSLISKLFRVTVHWLFAGMIILTLLPLATYFMIDRDLQSREYDITESFSIYKSIQSGKTMEISAINADLSNTQAIALHESNLNLYMPIFGYGLEAFHPEIVPGPIWAVTDGYYNMTNPSGYVFPEINGTRPFERVKVGDEKNLTLFLNHQKTLWKIPVYQQVFDWISGLTFWIVLAIFVVYPFRSKMKRKRNKSIQ